jgi:hypothetical protein
MSNEIPKTEKLPVSLATQSLEDRERESAELAGVEQAKRTQFFTDCVEGNEDLTPEQRTLVAKAMSVRKTAAWASFDGSDVKFVGIKIEGDVIVLTFDFFDGMNVVNEKIQM